MIRQRRKNKKKYLFISLISLTLFLLIAFFLFSVLKGFFGLISQYPFISPIPYALLSVKGVVFPTNNTTALDIKILLQKKQIPIGGIEQVSDTSYKVMLASGEEVYLSSQKPLSEQISSLQRILSRLTIEGKHFTRLDVRFDKPFIILK